VTGAALLSELDQPAGRSTARLPPSRLAGLPGSMAIVWLQGE
jgi:hypothetical protein